MRIRVRGFLTIRDVLGGQKVVTVELEEATIAGLLQELSVQFGESFERMFFDPASRAVSEQVAILVNGCHYSHLPNGLDTTLKDEDDVALFPPIAGG